MKAELLKMAVKLRPPGFTSIVRGNNDKLPPVIFTLRIKERINNNAKSPIIFRFSI